MGCTCKDNTSTFKPMELEIRNLQVYDELFLKCGSNGWILTVEISMVYGFSARLHSESTLVC